ncbi:MAG: hypothetical protein EA403_12010 [Spirochaetaceae bacterium]|nr:MAG: hypothetical protein EA403_12010 [Spirochaetaceae bacterium]
MKTVSWTSIGIAAIAILFFAGCAPERVDEAHRPRRTYSAYRHALTDMEIDRTRLGRRWLDAADGAVAGAKTVALPFDDILIFDPAEPEAVAVRFHTERGRTVTVRLTPDPRPPLFFVDVYRVIEDGDRVKIATLDSDGEGIVFRARRPASYLLRVQPELGRGGRVAIRVEQN